MVANHATSAAGQPPAGPELLTVAQAAARLSLSRTAVYELCSSKQLEHFCVGADGKGIRIEAAELAAFLERRRVARASPAPSPEISPRPRQQRAQVRNALGLVHMSVPKALRA